MSTTLTRRTIFIAGTTPPILDLPGFKADTGVQGATNLAQGNAIQVFLRSYMTLSAGVYTEIYGLELVWLLTSTNDVTVVAGIAAFAARWTNYTIYTWSETIVFGT